MLTSWRVSSWSVAAAAVYGAAGVIIGALAAHGFDSEPAGLEAADRLRLASDYLLMHAAPLLYCGLQLTDERQSVGRRRWIGIISTLFAIGVALFCGSLVALGLGAPTGLSGVTPIGGMALILAWLNLAGWALLFLRRASGE